jgi:hypothetical protein
VKMKRLISFVSFVCFVVNHLRVQPLAPFYGQRMTTACGLSLRHVPNARHGFEPRRGRSKTSLLQVWPGHIAD